jgi:hypothetical protein
MSGLSADLLRLLDAPANAASARLTNAIAGSGGGIGSARGPDFAALLQKARAGQIRTDLPVTLAAGVKIDLSDAQLARIAGATDLAQSQGAARALVMIDGLAVKVDVATRQIMGLADAKPGAVITGIDAIVHVDSAGNTTGAPARPATPGLDNASLRAILARSADAGAL